MSAIDYTLTAFAVVMIFGTWVNVVAIIRRERGLRALAEDVKRAGEARGVGASKDGGA